MARKRGTLGAIRRGHARNVTTAVGGGVAGGGVSGGTETSGGSSGITELTGDVTAGPGSGAQAATIANNAVTTAKIIDAAVTLAKMANLANKTLIGRNTAGAGVPEAVTLTQLLDWIGAAAQGDILYRGAAGWARLGAGTAGQFLKTLGAAADPLWATPVGGSPSAGGQLSIDAESQYVSAWAQGGNGSFFARGINSNANAVNSGNATVALTVTGEGTYQTLGTIASVGATSNLSWNTAPMIDWSYPFDLTFIVRTPADITSVRYWIGLAASAPTNSDTYGGGAPGRTISFRYSAPGSDAGWVGVCNDGTTQSTTPNPTTTPVAAIAASTRYRLRIRSDGSTAYFSVDGGTEISLATNFPGGATRIGPFVSCYTNVIGARSLHLQRWYGYVGL
jgi:hypothetical protein